MQLLGSVIYLTSYFLWIWKDSLVHWTHSFCIFMIAYECVFRKMGCSTRKSRKYQVKRE